MPPASPPVATFPPGRGLAFSLLGFPVRIRPEFLIISVLFGSSGGGAEQLVGWVAVVFVSVLFHELGHALVGRAFGCNAAIELHGMGGVTYFVRRDADAPPVSWFGDLLISLAGPFFGLSLGGAVWLLAARAPGFAIRAPWLVEQLLWVNIGWSFVNLVPVLPFDGGLALAAVLRRISPTRGPLVSHWLTISIAAVAVVAAIVFRGRFGGGIWIAYLALRGAAYSWTALKRGKGERALLDGWAAWDRRDYAAGRKAAETALALAADPPTKGASAELRVFAALAERDAAGAKAAWDAYPSEVQPSALLRAVVAIDQDSAVGATLLREAPELSQQRVLVPLITAWAGSPWEERAAAWLTDGTIAALPDAVSRSLGAQLFAASAFLLARQVLESRFRASHEAEDAYNVACCDARLGDVPAALDWLARAKEAGWDDLAGMDADEDLEAVRASPGYATFRAAPVEPEHEGER